ESVKRMLNREGTDKLTPNEKAQQAGEDFEEYNNPLTDFFFEYEKEYFEEERGTNVLKEYAAWCQDNQVRYPLGERRFKDAVCSHYNMEWKDKRIRLNGRWKTVKGF